MAAGGVDEETEDKGCNKVQEWTSTAWSSCFGLQTYKNILPENMQDPVQLDAYYDTAKKIMKEELFHMYTQYVVGIINPPQFGSTWSSEMCKETARLECLNPGWHHP